MTKNGIYIVGFKINIIREDSLNHRLTEPHLTSNQTKSFRKVNNYGSINLIVFFKPLKGSTHWMLTKYNLIAKYFL